jgi:hypothetical protein
MEGKTMNEPGIRIRLSEDLLQKLRDLSYEKSKSGKRVSMNGLIVEAIQEFLEKHL